MSGSAEAGNDEEIRFRLDLIVRTDSKPNTNQPTMHAVIAPASVASICAVEELPRTGD